MKTRVEAVIKEYSAKFSGKRILFVSHGWPIDSILEKNEGKSAEMLDDCCAHTTVFPLKNIHFASEDFQSADFIAEGIDQTRGWFYTLHAIATMVFDSVAYKNVVSNGLVLDKEGKKMSKRLGNAADPFETMDAHGADATRWYMISNANPWDNLKFDIDGIVEVKRKFFGTLYNTYSFFSLYTNIDEFKYSEEEVLLNERPEIDRWILSELNSLIKTVDDNSIFFDLTKIVYPLLAVMK